MPRDLREWNGFALIGEESFHSVGQRDTHIADVFAAKLNWLGEEVETSIIPRSKNGSR